MVKLGEVLALIGNPYRVRVIENKEIKFIGWIGTIANNEHYEELDLDRPVIRLSICPDVRHSRWKDLGLMPPVEPELEPQYKSDSLDMWIYYDVHIASEGGKA